MAVELRCDEVIQEAISILYQAADESAEADEAYDNYAEVNAQIMQKRFQCIQSLASFFSSAR